MLARALRGRDSGGSRMGHMEWNESENEWRVNRKRHTAPNSTITTESKKVCDVVKWRNRQLGATLHAQVIIIIIIIVCITNVRKVLILYFLVSAVFYAYDTQRKHTHTHSFAYDCNPLTKRASKLFSCSFAVFHFVLFCWSFLFCTIASEQGHSISSNVLNCRW